MKSVKLELNNREGQQNQAGPLKKISKPIARLIKTQGEKTQQSPGQKWGHHYRPCGHEKDNKEHFKPFHAVSQLV